MVDKKLDLSIGAVAKSLSSKAGPGLQDELNKNYYQGLKNGQIAVVPKHGALKCKHVLFGCLDLYSVGAGPSYEKKVCYLVVFIRIPLCEKTF